MFPMNCTYCCTPPDRSFAIRYPSAVTINTSHHTSDNDAPFHWNTVSLVCCSPRKLRRKPAKRVYVISADQHADSMIVCHQQKCI